MSDSLNNANPYEAYFKAMMEMQKEMANAYMSSMQNGDIPPMMMPHQMGMMPHFTHPAFCHPHQMPPGMGAQFDPGMMPPPPHWPHPGMMQHPPQPQQPPQHLIQPVVIQENNRTLQTQLQEVQNQLAQMRAANAGNTADNTNVLLMRKIEELERNVNAAAGSRDMEQLLMATLSQVQAMQQQSPSLIHHELQQQQQQPMLVVQPQLCQQQPQYVQPCPPSPERRRRKKKRSTKIQIELLGNDQNQVVSAGSSAAAAGCAATGTVVHPPQPDVVIMKKNCFGKKTRIN